MSQMTLLPATEGDESTVPQLTPADPELAGFAPFYQMLRTLVAVQEPATFYERVRVLLTLLRWPGDAPDITALVRSLYIGQEALARTLSLFRRDGWFKDQGDERHYALNFRGRILASTLQVLAQPFAEGDASPLATGIFLLADEMGARPELLGGFFDAAVASLEESAREMEALLESEDSALIAARLRSSKRDQKMAGQALDLREQGAVTNDQLGQVQHMHEAIVHLSEATHRLNRRQQELIARDLLARDLVTLGDIVAWAQGAGIDELAASLAEHVRLPLQPVWAGTERQLIEAYIEIDGKEPPPARGKVPVPLAVAAGDIGREMTEARWQLLRAQADLRARLAERDPQRLPEWVDEPQWDAALVRFLSATDPDLSKDTADPVYFAAEPAGRLATDLRGAVAAVTEGQISRQAPPARTETITDG
jgi:hypothetical protein